MTNDTPIGTIIMFSGREIPYGWMLCDGTPISKQKLSNTFKAISKVEINESLKKLTPVLKNSKLPDLRNRFVVGTGAKYKQHQMGEPDQHQHKVKIPYSAPKTTAAGKHSHKFPGSWYPRKFTGIAQHFSAIDTNGNNIDHASTQEEGNHTHQLPIHFPAFNSHKSSGRNRPRWYALCFIIKVLD